MPYYFEEVKVYYLQGLENLRMVERSVKISY